MSIIKDLLNKKKEVGGYNITVNDASDNLINETFTTNKWSHSWLAQVSKQHNFVINDDMKKVNGVLDALNRKSGQCPCGGTGEQFKCPCTIMREHGICKCGLFKSIPNRPITGRSDTPQIIK